MQDYPRPRTQGAYAALRKLDRRRGLYRDPGESTIPPPTTLVSAHGISSHRISQDVAYIKSVIWARTHGLHTIIDPHGVPG